MRSENEQPIGTINSVYFYQSDIDFCRRMITEYTANAEKNEQALETCGKSQRGGYAAQAKRARAHIAHWEKHLAAQLERVGKWGPVVQSLVGGEWQ